MKKSSHDLLPYKTGFSIFSLVALIFLIYGNTFDATWHFDDFPNIIERDALHLESLSPSALYNTFFKTNNQGERKLNRPVAGLTLALNWYFGKSKVWGYHLVNILIHCLSAVFLFFFIHSLLLLPRINIADREKRLFVSLLATVLWAANPIQIQAVTYIVQRMASLAGMFYILAMLLYIRGRCYSPTILKKSLFFSGSLAAFILGLFTKQNVILLPFAILLIEILFIQDLADPKTTKRVLIFSLMVVTAAVAAGVCMVWSSNLLGGYDQRPFSLFERVLTQPRILVFYLSLIFYPIPARLNLDHDVVVSTGLLFPWQTAGAIFFILLLVTFAVVRSRRNPIMSLAILFFFLNHGVESTILPLELIFEHRNYIPSMLLFVPLAMGLYWILEHYKQKKQSMFLILSMFVIFVMVNLGVATHLRNAVWFSEKSLWEDCISKNNNSARSYHNLAWGHYEKLGMYDQAIQLFKTALTKKDNTGIYRITSVYNSIAQLYYQQENYENAEEYWLKSLEVFPTDKALHGMFLVHLEKKEVDRAIYYIEKAIALFSSNPNFFLKPLLPMYLNNKGIALMINKDPDGALAAFQKSLTLKPSALAYLGMGAACSMTEFSNRTEWYLRQASKMNDAQIHHLYLADHYLRHQEPEKTTKAIRKYLSVASFSEIDSFIEKLFDKNLFIPIQPDLIRLLQEEAGRLYQTLETKAEPDHETR